MRDAKRSESASLWRSAEDLSRVRCAKRESVLRVAVELFNERGFVASSLDEVAARLGVTKPTIYHYFKTKEDILVEGVRQGMATLQPLLNAETQGTGFERVRRFLHQYAEQAATPFMRCVNRTDEYELSEPNRSNFLKLKRSVDHAIQEMFVAGIEDGSITRDVDPKIATFAVIGALNGISRWFKPNGEMSASAVKTEMVDFLLRSMVP